MNNLYTLKVYPNKMGREVYRVLQICGDYTLDDLCYAILDAFEFTYEHLYEFCMDNMMYGNNSYHPDRAPYSNIKLDKLELAVKQKFLFHYDFGDDWEFIVNVQKIEEIPRRIKPKVTSAKGEIE